MTSTRIVAIDNNQDASLITLGIWRSGRFVHVVHDIGIGLDHCADRQRKTLDKRVPQSSTILFTAISAFAFGIG